MSGGVSFGAAFETTQRTATSTDKKNDFLSSRPPRGCPCPLPLSPHEPLGDVLVVVQHGHSEGRHGPSALLETPHPPRPRRPLVLRPHHAALFHLHGRGRWEKGGGVGALRSYPRAGAFGTPTKPELLWWGASRDLGSFAVCFNCAERHWRNGRALSHD